jgi:phosphoribosyl 1,2-cyclic phosphodiesterase
VTQNKNLSSALKKGSLAEQESGIRAILWGVRGTLPTPGETTRKYGGNTACVEVRVWNNKNSLSLVLDAGSGLPAYGEQALARGEREFHIFLSHVHYDHILGLTRFAPIFRRDCSVHFYGLKRAGQDLHEVLRHFFQHPYFPVEYDALGANPNLSFHHFAEADVLNLGPARVRFQSLNHPQGSVAFRIEEAASNVSMVYATDHEHGTDKDEKLIEFSHQTDLLLCDCTYNLGNYERFKGWGHSTAHHGALFAKQSEAKVFGLFHHDPGAADQDLERVALVEARTQFERSFLCAEGMNLCLNTLPADLGLKLR